MKTNRFILMILAAVTATAACEKNAVLDLDREDVRGGNVKFFNFSVGSPSVNFYVGSEKVTAVSSVGCYLLDDQNRQECLSTGRESTSGVAYGNAGNGGSGWYSDVTPGSVTISGRIASDNPPADKNLAISNTPATVEVGRFYSYYLSGVYNATTKTADSFIIEDVLPETDFSVAHIRFVNASPTAEPVTLYAINRTTQAETAIGGPVAYKGASAWTALEVGVSYDFQARTAGGTVVFSRTAVAFNAGRAHTIAARGNPATNTGMFLDNTANR